jgi:hypothetical protein
MELTQDQKDIYKGKICPYCFKKSHFINSKEIYGVSHGMVYACKPCKAHVGVHQGTKKAKGRLANKELRKAKIEAHKYFDSIWKEGEMKRKEAYLWLSQMLNIPEEYTHIGMFNLKTCKEVIFYSLQLIQDMKQIDKDFDAL